MPQYKPGTIQIRRYTTAQWAAFNPVLADGELGYDIGPAPSATTGTLKVGDGHSRWLDLTTFAGPTGQPGPQGDPGPPGALSLQLADSSLTNTGTAANPVLAVGDLSGNPLAVSVANLSAQQGQLMAVAATVEELTVTAHPQGHWSGSTWVQTLSGSSGYEAFWVAPFTCTVNSAALMASAAVPVDAVNYVQVQLNRLSAGTYTQIVQKQSSGEAITAGTAWSFAGATWDTAAAVLAPGDALAWAVNSFGTAVATFPFTLTCQIQPPAAS